jgi:hypothetical protein
MSGVTTTRGGPEAQEAVGGSRNRLRGVGLVQGLRRFWPLALLVGLMWIVRYWHSGQFGLYEDDLTHLPTAAAMSLGQAVSFAFDPGRILRLEGQGHPLHYTFIYLLTNLGWRIGDLHGPYWIGFAIEALNVCLFYNLLRRVHSWQLGLIGALAFVLYSADTTQAYLTYSLGLQPSLTLFLLAGLAYSGGRRWLAYLLAPFMLLTYETFYPVFFALPLLFARSRTQRVRELVSHFVILGLILAAFSFWRLQVGDDRLGGLAARDALLVPLLHMVQGPLVSLGTYVYRLVQTVQGIDLEVAVASVIATVFFVWLLSRMKLGAPAGLHERLATALALGRRSLGLRASLREAVQALPAELTSLVRLIGAGAAMLALAYPLTFTVRAYAISGRDTRVHAAGVLGAAVLVGSAALLALWTAEAFGRRRWVALAFGAWFGLLAGYGFVLQRDYRLAWVYQREFWSELVQLVPDVAEGDAILVDPGGLKDTRQIGANYWNLPVVLEQLYRFPVEWRRSPWVYRMAEDWQSGILDEDGSLTLDARTTYAPPSTYREVDPAATMLIRTANGTLLRQASPLELGGTPIALKTLHGPEMEPPFPHGFLYRYLITAGGE